MIDPKLIETNPERVITAFEQRGDGDGAGRRAVEDIQVSLAARREHVRVIQTYQETINNLSATVHENQKAGMPNDQIKEQIATLKKNKATAESRLEAVERRLEVGLLYVPNIPADDVPVGADETANVVESFGAYDVSCQDGPDHIEIAGRFGGMETIQTVRMSGSRFTSLKGPLARLERALGNFMMDLHTANGWLEVSPPLVVKSEALTNTGQLPKFTNDLLHVGGLNLDSHLIPTAEVPLTNLVSDRVLAPEDLPIRMVAHTACFRSEAGAAGRDTRGLIRQHQFHKVELVTICEAEQSQTEHQFMQAAAATVLDHLELPFRRVLLCTGDMGFSAQKTYDFEVWLPSQGTYREISSVSNCGDFQARRMKARVKHGKDKPVMVHTLNGSGVAVGRALVALLENHWDGEKLYIPKALRSYVGADFLWPDA